MSGRQLGWRACAIMALALLVPWIAGEAANRRARKAKADEASRLGNAEAAAVCPRVIGRTSGDGYDCMLSQWPGGKRFVLLRVKGPGNYSWLHIPVPDGTGQ